MSTTTRYSPERSTAIHEAGHGVMAYWLGRRFKAISVEEDDDSLGRVEHLPAPDWLQPEFDTNCRTRTRIEQYVMTALAGGETEAAWSARLIDAPAGWQQRVTLGAGQDRRRAIDLASYVCGSNSELGAYIEWLRQRVLNFTGRGADAEINENDPPSVADVQRYGDRRFWALTEALADAVQEARTMLWRDARSVLRRADQEFMEVQLRGRWASGSRGRAELTETAPPGRPPGQSSEQR